MLSINHFQNNSFVITFTGLQSDVIFETFGIDGQEKNSVIVACLQYHLMGLNDHLAMQCSFKRSRDLLPVPEIDVDG